MALPAVDLIPLLAASAAGAPTQSYMPFVLIAAPILLVLLLLFLVGRNRRNRKPGDHD